MKAFRVRLIMRSVALTLSAALAIALAIANTKLAHATHARETLAARLPAPRAVTPFLSFNFGDVYTGEVISQIFIVRNEGDSELVITSFTAGCGCTVASADRVVAPGREGTATVEVQTISQSGEISKTATLHTNDPERPAIVFTMAANVLKGSALRQGKYIGPVFLSPGSSGALYVLPGKKAITEFSVTAEGAPVKVLSVEGGTKHFTSRVEVIEAGRSYKIVVESLSLEAGDLYRDQLRVITDSIPLPAFPIDMSLRVYSRQ